MILGNNSRISARCATLNTRQPKRHVFGVVNSGHQEEEGRVHRRHTAVGGPSEVGRVPTDIGLAERGLLRRLLPPHPRTGRRYPGGDSDRLRTVGGPGLRDQTQKTRRFRVIFVGAVAHTRQVASTPARRATLRHQRIDPGPSVKIPSVVQPEC